MVQPNHSLNFRVQNQPILNTLELQVTYSFKCKFNKECPITQKMRTTKQMMGFHYITN